jgi:hypothetical protein
VCEWELVKDVRSLRHPLRRTEVVEDCGVCHQVRERQLAPSRSPNTPRDKNRENTKQREAGWSTGQCSCGGTTPSHTPRIGAAPSTAIAHVLLLQRKRKREREGREITSGVAEGFMPTVRASFAVSAHHRRQTRGAREYLPTPCCRTGCSEATADRHWPCRRQSLPPLRPSRLSSSSSSTLPAVRVPSPPARSQSNTSGNRHSG